MNPNQQPYPPTGSQPPQPPQQPPTPGSVGYAPAGSPQQPTAQPAPPPTPQPQQVQQFSAPQPTAPQAPTAYASSTPPNYDPNYLDSIAPPPPPPKFFSGAFGKIFFGLIAVFFVVVSVMVAFSGQDKTADLQQAFIRLENMEKTVKTVHTHLKSNNLSNINTTFQIWLAGNKAEAENLLKEGGVQRTDYGKAMVAEEKQRAEDLDAKFEDARLSATLNRVYASTMAAETEKIIIMLDTMTKKSQSAKIRDYAKNASANLKQVQEDFSDYNDDGN